MKLLNERILTMRNYFAIVLAVVSLFVMSCEPKINTSEDVKFEITTGDTLTIGAEGGVVNITYTLTGGTGVYSDVHATADNKTMVTAINTDDSGVVRVAVAQNSEYFEREAQVRISYDGESYFVTIKQEARNGEDDGRVVVNANQFDGTYYGEELGAGVGHYWIILSDGGFREDGGVRIGGEFFRIELIGPASSDPENARIPDGEYHYDISNSLAQYTILALGNSDYTYVDENEEGWAVSFMDATLKVSGNKLVLEATTQDNSYVVTYEGDYTLKYSSFSEVVSTLKDDLVIDLSNCKGSAECYADNWVCGLCNWYILFEDKRGWDQGVYVTLELLTDNKLDGSSGFEGKYVAGGVDADDPTLPLFGSYTFVSGHRMSSEASYLLGTLYLRYENGTPVEQTVMRGGEIEVTANADGTHTIVVNATDDAEPAHNITLNWTGKLN